MKRIIITLIAILNISTVAVAQSEITPDAEYNLIRRSYQLNDDGSIDINYRKELKLIRNRSITEYADKGETFIVYNPSCETLTINESYTLQPDGTKVVTPSNAFVNQLPSNCADCDGYNGYREMAIIHTGLVPECVIVLDYTIHRSGSDILHTSVILTEDCPVKQNELIVKASNRHKIHFSENNLPENAKRQYDNGVYHLTLNDVAQSYNEPYMPAGETMYPTVYITNQPNGDQITDLTPLANKSLTISEALQNSLKREKQDEHLIAIRDHVINNVRLNDIAPATTGFQYQEPQTTYNNNCGTQIDKALLLAAMYNNAGYTAKIIPSFKEYKSSDAGNSVTLRMLDATNTAIQVSDKGLTYMVYPVKGKPMHLVGAAIDDVHHIDTTRSLEWAPSVLSDGYVRFTLPNEKSRFNIDPSRLTSNRKSPVKVQPVDERYQYTVMLPYGVKMISKNVKIEQKEDGIGSVEIKIRQDGNKLTIVRHLTIMTDLITVDQYDEFRELVQIWNSNKELLFKQ